MQSFGIAGAWLPCSRKSEKRGPHLHSEAYFQTAPLYLFSSCTFDRPEKKTRVKAGLKPEAQTDEPRAFEQPNLLGFPDSFGRGRLAFTIVPGFPADFCYFGIK